MTLPAEYVAILKANLEQHLPPAALAVDRGGIAIAGVTGYVVADDDRTLDELGMVQRDATLEVVSSTVAVGDEVDTLYVAWAIVPSEVYPTLALRSLPAFSSWTTRVITRGPDLPTGEPGAPTTTLGTAVLYVLPSTGTEVQAGGTTTVRRHARGIARAPLALGTEISHADYGSYRVVEVMPYGPWYRHELTTA